MRMPARLENLTARPVVLVLASGEPLRLAPREVSEDVADVEVTRSARVAELAERGVIAVHRPAPRAAGSRARRSR
jgi:hypothetical protein